MTQHEKSAIIGYFRNGMPVDQIAILMSITVFQAQKIIDNHLKNTDHGREKNNSQQTKA